DLHLRHGFLAVLGRDHLVALLREQVGDEVALGRGIVDDQDLVCGHDFLDAWFGCDVDQATRWPAPTSASSARRANSRAARSSASLVKGLVRYWSEPTM